MPLVPAATQSVLLMDLSTMLSVGQPLLHASTGSTNDMASTGTIPKCSFAGVYCNASVDGAERRAARWVVAKLSTKRMSGSLLINHIERGYGSL